MLYKNRHISPAQCHKVESRDLILGVLVILICFMFYKVYIIVLMLFAFITELFHRIVIIMAHVLIPVAPCDNVGASMVVYHAII